MINEKKIIKKRKRKKKREIRRKPRGWSSAERFRPDPPPERLMNYKWIGKNYKDLTDKDEKNTSE